MTLHLRVIHLSSHTVHVNVRGFDDNIILQFVNETLHRKLSALNHPRKHVSISTAPGILILLK